LERWVETLGGDFGEYVAAFKVIPDFGCEQNGSLNAYIMTVKYK
jgi:hypothetical protein